MSILQVKSFTNAVLECLSLHQWFTNFRQNKLSKRKCEKKLFPTSQN